MTPVETLSQPVDLVSLETIEFHPLVKAELYLELKKWIDALEKIPPERLQSVQGKVEILKWVLQRMPSEIIQKQRAKAQAAETQE